ncbi:MAG: molybdopterin oxidoreductase family protein [Burkholderiaceae bacterium]|nr:molybdopterin oxidoreductase family protein [Burkholderiaceae bacterium]
MSITAGERAPQIATVADIVPSVCPHDCTSVCALEVERIDARTIGRVRGSKRNDYTAGVICEKVSRYAQRIHHPDRLTRPLRRTGAKGSGAFEPIGWSDALDIVAQAFQDKAKRFGSETVWPYMYAGTMGLVQRDGINRLRHAMRYSRWYSTICVTLADNGWVAGTGAKRGADLREAAEHAELIVIWGGNPVNTQVNVMTHVMAAKKRGAKLVVVDPYRTGTAERADVHLALRPGTDAALACAVMHVLFAEGFADWDYLRRFTDAPEELAAHVADRPPQWAAQITGLSVDEIVSFARMYGKATPSFIRCHHGFSRSRNGAANMHAVSCLPAVTGAWQRRGGGALYGHSALYPLDRTLIEGLDLVDSEIRALDQSRLGPILTGDADALRGGPAVTAMLVQNTNPAMVCPELHKVHAGLAREDLFLCVHEQFMTDTARFADIVLPATMFLEHDDVYIASGHTTLQVARKVVEPPGECRENHFVIGELARRLGAEHDGFGMSAWEIVDQTLVSSGLWDASTNWSRGGQNCELPFERANFLDGFAWPDGKFRFKPDWSRLGGRWREMPVLPDHLDVIDRATPGKPFRLVAAPARTFLNSTFTETPGSLQREKRPTLLIHPDDCAALEIATGDRVELGNERGCIDAHAESRSGQQRGVVVLEGLWPNRYFGAGVGVNALTSAEPGWPNGGAVFHDTAIWVRKAGA